MATLEELEKTVSRLQQRIRALENAVGLPSETKTLTISESALFQWSGVDKLRIQDRAFFEGRSYPQQLIAEAVQRGCILSGNALTTDRYEITIAADAPNPPGTLEVAA